MQDHDDFAQDLYYVLARSEETFCRVVDFGIDITAPTIGLRRVPQETTKTAVRYVS